MDNKEEQAVRASMDNPPTNIKELRKLLSFLGYCRSYVQDCSRHVKCLCDLLSVDNTPDSKTPGWSAKVGHAVPTQQIIWNDRHQKAPDYLVDVLTNPPVMAYPRFEEPLILPTDASEEGLGGVFLSDAGQ